MDDSTSSRVVIPVNWRKTVVDILRGGDKEKIYGTQQADRDWQAACPRAWDYERYEAMADALDNDEITGRYITNMEPKCDAYEFWFNFDKRKFLGKIGLLPDGKIIIVFSSHIPRRGDSL